MKEPQIALSRKLDVRPVEFRRSSQGAARPLAFEVPVETPVAFVYGSIPYAAMMATPGDLEDFAFGFSLTEGVVDSIDEIRGARVAETPDGLEIHIELSGERLARHLARRRNMTGRTGCGLCGISDLASLPRAQPSLAPARPITAAAMNAALCELETQQPLNARTRAVHAAAFADAEGRIALVREDVGRHNALDKLIGALKRAGLAANEGFVAITSRCSFEMVEKTAAGGVHTLVAVSAPTSLAIERANRYGMTLVAVARSDYGLAFVQGGSQADAKSTR